MIVYANTSSSDRPHRDKLILLIRNHCVAFLFKNIFNQAHQFSIGYGVCRTCVKPLDNFLFHNFVDRIF